MQAYAGICTGGSLIIKMKVDDYILLQQICKEVCIMLNRILIVQECDATKAK